MSSTNVQEVSTDKLVSNAIRRDASLQFNLGTDGLNGTANANNYTGAHVAGSTVGLVVIDLDGLTSSLNGVSTVLLTAGGGTAPRLNGSLTPIRVQVENGTTRVTVTDSAAGTVTVTMSSATHPSATLTLEANPASVVLS